MKNSFKSQLLNTKLLMMLLGGLFLSMESGAQESKNLLQNPGFEETMPAVFPAGYEKTWPNATEVPKGWGINYTDNTGKLTVIDDPEASHGGMRYIRLEREDPKEVAFQFPGNVQLAPQTKPGDKYSVSIWAKGKGKLNIYAYLLGNDEGKSFKSSLCSGYLKVSSDEWTQFKWEITIPEDKSIGCFILAFHVTGAIDLDDALLSPLK